MLRSLWSRIRPPKDPYEDFFLNIEASDPRNLIVNRIREAPEGSVFAVKAETHTPEVMAAHVKELGRFFGADATYIVDRRRIDAARRDSDRVDDGLSEELPYAVFCLFRAEHDPRESPGIGGHTAALKAAFATFQTSAIIREFGFHATRASDFDLDAAAALAGIGTLDGKGRLTTPDFGYKLHIADVILTDLPVATD